MDGEVEHGVALPDHGASRGRGAAGGRQHLGLELQELAHEAEVGRDDAAPLLDELEGLLESDAVGAHQVRQADGGGARDPRLAVDEHTAAFITHRICGKQRRVSVKRCPTPSGQTLSNTSQDFSSTTIRDHT